MNLGPKCARLTSLYPLQVELTYQNETLVQPLKLSVRFRVASTTPMHYAATKPSEVLFLATGQALHRLPVSSPDDLARLETLQLLPLQRPVSIPDIWQELRHKNPEVRWDKTTAAQAPLIMLLRLFLRPFRDPDF